MPVVTVEWEGRPVEAFVPTPLAALGPLGAATQRDTARAEGVLAASSMRHDPRLDVAARLLLRAEGVASSQIEAVSAAAALVAVADVDESVDGPAAWVADNLRALDLALAHDAPLDAQTLWRWHRALMRATDLDARHVGAWRDRLGWVGGPSPLRAAHVATPPELIAEAMADLVEYANAADHDAVTTAALVHAQFETIHPFADGNGRVGRLLIAWVLRRRLDLTVPPPVSVALLHDVGGYLSGLVRFRIDGPDAWVRWFAGTIENAATSASATLTRVSDLVGSWPARLGGVRADAAARRLVEHLVEHPALDVTTAAQLLGVSRPAARGALETLVAHGVLRHAEVPSTGGNGRPRRWWVAGDLLDLLAR